MIKKPLYLFFLIIIGCSQKPIENADKILQASNYDSKGFELAETPKTKAFFDLITNKKESAQDLPRDFDFSKNYTEKELKALQLNPAKIKANEYYFLSEQRFLREDIQGFAFQIYYRHDYGNQLEKILRVQKSDTVFDIILAGKYSNGMNGSTLSTEFTNYFTFKKSIANTLTVRDEPNLIAFEVDSLLSFYSYNNKFDFLKNNEFTDKWYKEIKLNPETGTQETLMEQMNSLGVIENTEFFSGVSFDQYSINLPESISIYSVHKKTRTKLKTIETWGAYIDDMELFSMDGNHFIYIKMMETSGNSYSYFYAIDSKMSLVEVQQDFSHSKIPDSLQIHKGFGLTKETNNSFTSGGIMRSQTKSYYFDSEHIMIKENGKFILKCIKTEITPTDQ